MIRALAILTTATCALAQPNPEWTRAFPAHRIVGNVYYVGTYDLTSYLIATPRAISSSTLAWKDRLVDQGQRGVAGFKISDTKILLATHAHYDHIAAMAELKR